MIPLDPEGEGYPESTAFPKWNFSNPFPTNSQFSRFNSPTNPYAQIHCSLAPALLAFFEDFLPVCRSKRGPAGFPLVSPTMFNQ